MRQEIVLDKSYLQGAPTAAIHELCAQFRVIMPGALFFELITTTPKEQTECFAKLPQVMNPVEMVEHVGRLLRYERRTKKPSPPLYARRHRLLFTFNARLADGTFLLTDAQQAGKEAWEEEVRQEVQNFQETVSLTHHWFPDIEQASNKDRPTVIEGIQALVASDSSMVRRLYGSIRRRSFPKPAMIDERWAYFRWMQVHLLAALDHIKRYGVGSDLATAKDLDKEVVDLQYRIMGVLAGAIATKDKKSKQVYGLLRPDGLCLS